MRHLARRGDGGQSTVELALVLPALAVLLLAVLQVGLTAREVVLVTHATREAARAAAVDPTPTAARHAALASSGLQPNHLVVEVRRGTGPDARVTVVLTYRSTGSLPLIGRFLRVQRIRSTASMRVEPDSDRPRSARIGRIRTNHLLSSRISDQTPVAEQDPEEAAPNYLTPKRGPPTYSPRNVVAGMLDSTY